MATNAKKKGNGFLAAGLASLTAFAILLVLAFTMFKTETYYILNQDVPARTQVTADMLQPKTVSDGGAPTTAYSKEQIESKPMFTKVDMIAGEPLTASNAGDLNPVNRNIPENFTVASLSLPPVQANLGAIKPGDHIDIYYTSEDKGTQTQKSTMVLQNVLVVNAGSSVETANARTEKNTKSGEKSAPAVNTVYQVAVSPENAANLAVLSSQSGQLYVTPTPATGVTNKAVQSTIDITGNTANAPIDASAGAKAPAKDKGDKSSTNSSNEESKK